MVLTRSSSFSHAERRRALRTLTERDVSPRPRSARSTAKEDLGRTIRPHSPRQFHLHPAAFTAPAQSKVTKALSREVRELRLETARLSRKRLDDIADHFDLAPSTSLQPWSTAAVKYDRSTHSWTTSCG